MTTSLAVAIFFIVLAAADDGGITAKFGLSSVWWVCISTDLGGAEPSCKLHYRGHGGIPDAVFRHRISGTLIIGEFKGRKYADTLRWHEYFQTQLYIGFASQGQGISGRVIEARIAYEDAVVRVRRDRRIFKELLAIAEEMPKLVPGCRPKDARPLQQRRRIKVNAKRVS